MKPKAQNNQREQEEKGGQKICDASQEYDAGTHKINDISAGENVEGLVPAFSKTPLNESIKQTILMV